MPFPYWVILMWLFMVYADDHFVLMKEIPNNLNPCWIELGKRKSAIAEIMVVIRMIITELVLLLIYIDYVKVSIIPSKTPPIAE